MIRKPPWLVDELEKIARDVLGDKQTIADASDALAGKIDITDKPTALAIIADRCVQWTRQEMHKLVRAATKIAEDEQSSGQGALLPLPFPWLPAYLEVAPGRSVHQRVMTGGDWDHARAIWRNRYEQADLSWRGFERAYGLVRELLSGEATTADVESQLRFEGFGDDAGHG